MLAPTVESSRHDPWNKDKLVGQKSPLKIKEIWAIRVRLKLAIESASWRRSIWRLTASCAATISCNSVRDVAHGDRIAARTIVMQQKTQRPVQFEITEPTRKSLYALIRHAALKTEDYLFPSRIQLSLHLSTRQYARIVETWVAEIGLDVSAYGTHSMRRTKPSLIYRRTKNLRAVQLLLGHTKLESTVRYLGVEVDAPLRWLNRPRCSGWAAPAD